MARPVPRIICEPQILMSARPAVEIERRCRNAARHDEGRERERSGRERETRREKETRYILYDSVIAFPRTNIASRPSGRKKTSTLIVVFSFSPRPSPSPFSLSLPLSRPRNPSSFLEPRNFLAFHKRFPSRFLLARGESPPRACDRFHPLPPAASISPLVLRIPSVGGPRSEANITRRTWRDTAITIAAD